MWMQRARSRISKRQSGRRGQQQTKKKSRILVEQLIQRICKIVQNSLWFAFNRLTMGEQNALQTRVVGPVEELLTELRLVFDDHHFGDRGNLRIVVTKPHDVE